MKPTAIIQLIVAASAVTHVSCVPWKKLVPHWNKLSAFAGTEGGEPNLTPRWDWGADSGQSWGRWSKGKVVTGDPTSVTEETGNAYPNESGATLSGSRESQHHEGSEETPATAVQRRTYTRCGSQPFSAGSGFYGLCPQFRGVES